MHKKFGVHEAVKKLTPELLYKFLEFRFKFLQEEIDEGFKEIEGLPEGDVSVIDPQKRADLIVDAIIDLCVVAIGTLDAYNVDAYTAWDRVLEANMAKEPGVNPNRPNAFGLPDLIKPKGWTAPTHVDNVGLIEGALA
jgi:hypothetical protein